jgi:hypothetical protein
MKLFSFATQSENILFSKESSTFLLYKNATIAIAFEISSICSETLNRGENKGRLCRFVLQSLSSLRFHRFALKL